MTNDEWPGFGLLVGVRARQVFGEDAENYPRDAGATEANVGRRWSWIHAKSRFQKWLVHNAFEKQSD
jgi:hypothetical protein